MICNHEGQQGAPQPGDISREGIRGAIGTKSPKDTL